MIEAVVFDLDGLLIDSEQVWDAVRERYVTERGGRYDAEVQRALMGMSSLEWSRYLHEAAGVPDEPGAINEEVVRRMLAAYRERLPLVDGAVEAVERIAARWPLALASSSNRPLIEAALDLHDLGDEEDVVAGVLRAPELTLQPPEGSFDQGAERARACRDAMPMRDRRHAAREVLRDRLLLAAQQAERASPGFPEKLERRAVLPERDADERRLERERHERRDGDAHRLTFVLDREDGDSVRPVAHQAAQVVAARHGANRTARRERLAP